MKETFKIGSMYDENVWQRMVAESCGSQFTDGAILQGARKRIFKKKYAVCIETEDKDIIIHWTDDRDFPLKQGQFLVDDETRTVVEEEGLKERFEKLHNRLIHID